MLFLNSTDSSWCRWDEFGQIWSLVLISLDDSVGFLPWWAGRLSQRLFSRTSWVIRCWFPCRFKADLTAEARGAITACLEDLWHIQVNAKGAYCCRIMSLSETDRTSKTVSDVKQRSPLLILTHHEDIVELRWKQRTPGSDNAEIQYQLHCYVDAEMSPSRGDIYPGPFQTGRSSCYQTLSLDIVQSQHSVVH